MSIFRLWRTSTETPGPITGHHEPIRRVGAPAPVPCYISELPCWNGVLTNMGEKLNFRMVFHCKLLQLNPRYPWCARRRTGRNNLTMLMNFPTSSVYQCGAVPFGPKAKPQHQPIGHAKGLGTSSGPQRCYIEANATCHTEKPTDVTDLWLRILSELFDSSALTCDDLSWLMWSWETFLVYKAREHALTGGDGETIIIPHNFWHQIAQTHWREKEITQYDKSITTFTWMYCCPVINASQAQYDLPTKCG